MDVKQALAAWMVASLAAGGIGAASAAEPAWPAAAYDYVVVDQDLRTVLEQFGANVGLRISISEAVQGRVRGRLPPLQPRQFLNHLAQAYRLDWYYDGTTLAVSAASEAETRFLPLQGLDVPALEAGLRSTGLLDARFVVRSGPGPDTALVSGPPRYVRLVQETVAALAVRTPAPALADVRASMTVFRGASEARVQLP